MAQNAGTSWPEAEATRAAITGPLETLRTDIQGVLDDLKRTAPQLLDHVLTAQVLQAREILEHVVPLLNKGLAQGQAAARAVLEQARHAAPHVATAQ